MNAGVPAAYVFLMEDTNDLDIALSFSVEEDMRTGTNFPIAWANFSAGASEVRVAGQKLARRLDLPNVGFGPINAPCSGAVIPDGFEIVFRARA
jgi:hypothetical protein